MSDTNEPNWERKVLEKVALEAVSEQRRARRWGLALARGRGGARLPRVFLFDARAEARAGLEGQALDLDPRHRAPSGIEAERVGDCRRMALDRRGNAAGLLVQPGPFAVDWVDALEAE